jgi:hypothetical protein
MKHYFLLISLFFAGFCFASDDIFYASGYEESVLPRNTPRPPKPLMWNARLKVDRSLIIGYEKAVYTPNQYFSLYTGVSSGLMKTIHPVMDDVYVLSGYLLARFYFYNTSSFKTYILYSPAGPSMLSKSQFATTGFSNLFVFQNQFGIGWELDKSAKIGCFLKMYHYSNGDLFPVNGGIDIPLVFGINVRL